MSDSFVTPWTVAYQSPLSMGFPRQEYWNGLPFPSPGIYVKLTTNVLTRVQMCSKEMVVKNNLDTFRIHL